MTPERFERPREALKLEGSMLHAARDRLSTVRAREGDRVDAIAVGSPHFSIDEFRRLHPEIKLETKAVLSYEGLTRHEYDAAIRYGSANGWSGWVSERLTTEEMFPVCSPKLRKKHRLKRPEDLSLHDVIRSSSPVLRDEWPAWLARADIPHLHFKNEIVCDLIFFSLQAAIDGLGVAMGRRSLVSRDIESTMKKILPLPFASAACPFRTTRTTCPSSIAESSPGKGKSCGLSNYLKNRVASK